MSPWIEQEFAQLDLGDQRLKQRLCRVLEGMWQSPRSSTAAACGGWNDTMAAYRLFDNDAVTVAPICGSFPWATGRMTSTRCSRSASRGQASTNRLPT